MDIDFKYGIAYMDFKWALTVRIIVFHLKEDRNAVLLSNSQSEKRIDAKKLQERLAVLLKINLRKSVIYKKKNRLGFYCISLL